LVDVKRTDLVDGGLLRVAEAARMLGLGRSKVYLLMYSGELQYCKIGRARRIPRTAVLELAAKSLTQAPNSPESVFGTVGQPQKPTPGEGGALGATQGDPANNPLNQPR